MYLLQRRKQRPASPGASTEKATYAPFIIESGHAEVVHFDSDQRALAQERTDRLSSLHSKGGNMKDSQSGRLTMKQALTYQDNRMVIVEGSANARKLSSEPPTTSTATFTTFQPRRATKELSRSTRRKRRTYRDRSLPAVRRKHSSQSTAGKDKRRVPQRYSTRWKAFWFTGVAVSTALVVSAFTKKLDYDFIQRVEENGGALPREASQEDVEKYNALARLCLGIYALGVTATSYLVKRFRKKPEKDKAETKKSH